MSAPLIAEIQSAVCAHYNLPRSAMIEKSRFVRVARPRQIAMYLAKNMTVRTFPEIGLRFGNRDHSTVIHAVRRIGDLMIKDREIETDVNSIMDAIISRNSPCGDGVSGD